MVLKLQRGSSSIVQGKGLAHRAGRISLVPAKRGERTVARVASPARDSAGVAERSRPAGNQNNLVFTSTKGLNADTKKELEEQPRHEDKPGTKDDSTFPQHWSVRLWRDFRVPSNIKDKNLSTSQRVQNTIAALQEGARIAGVFNSRQSLLYWTYHVPRMVFFAANGIAGVAFSNYIQNSRAQDNSAGGSSGKKENNMDLGKLVREGAYVPISEALVTFYQDYQNIRNGVYKMPWDMTTLGHRQTNPGFVLGKVARFFEEAGNTMERRTAKQPDDVWLDSNMYPDYYLNTWHYQTDGWLSDKSAAVYETSTETVFIGRQDAMQRQSLVPISEFMKENFSKDGAGFELLDIATGTGRYATFVKDNFPKMGITQLDLSPFYLARARENLEYWRSCRGGNNPEDSVASKDKFLHAPAEQIPVPDESYDIVLSTYLFHEIPEDSRMRAAKEMERACKPGGMVILSDGVQYGDRPVNDNVASNFQSFNEPNWGTHVRTDYGKLFADLGLVPHKKILASGTKILSWKKMPRN